MNNDFTRMVKCPTCGEMVEWTTKNPWRPFCRERCRLIDLGEWAAENHRIASTTPEDFEDDGTQPD